MSLLLQDTWEEPVASITVLPQEMMTQLVGRHQSPDETKRQKKKRKKRRRTHHFRSCGAVMVSDSNTRNPSVRRHLANTLKCKSSPCLSAAAGTDLHPPTSFQNNSGGSGEESRARTQTPAAVKEGKEMNSPPATSDIQLQQLYEASASIIRTR